MKTQQLVQVSLIAEQSLAGAPTRFRLFPWGKVTTTKGEFIVDDVAALAAIDEFRRRGVDLVIDWEHTSVGGEFARPDRKSPAAGWIKDLDIVANDGVYAHVDWTPEGKADIESGAYRYFSPDLLFRKDDRRLARIRSVGLTNRPATIMAEPLVATDYNVPADPGGPDRGASTPDEEHAMKPELLEVLALKEGASEDDVVSAVKSLKETADGETKKASDAETKLAAVCKALDADPALETDKLEAKVLAMRHPTDKVDRTEHERMAAQLKELAASAAKRDADELIASAKSEGKLVAAQEEWARSLIAKDRDQFTAWAKSAPVVRPPGQTEAPDDGESDADPSGKRKSIIAKATKEWRTEPQLQKLCAVDAAVNDSLREAGCSLLTDDEVQALVV